MIKKLQKKFIILSMTALLILLSAIITSMNLLNYHAVITEADDTLEILAENAGHFPEFDSSHRPPNMSPEMPYESRYFSVLIGRKGEILHVDTGKIKAVDSQQAIDYALQITAKEKNSGFIDDFRYFRHTTGNETRIIFLDCGRKIASFHQFLQFSIIMAFTGYVVFFFVIFFFSGKFIRPVTESYEKQKRFITDAGHEIKTPLTIINADTDVLEMELGENEWLTDIQKQTTRLKELTDNLIYLSRMEEDHDSLQMIEFSLSDVVSEAASSFQALAQLQGKEFFCDISPMLSMTGNEKAITQLINILLDNALKYSPENGVVSLKVERQNKTLLLSVCNTTNTPIPKEKLDLFFERFYRADPSRHSEISGYGIGLSIAKAIVTAHNGNICAKQEDEQNLVITASFPS